ncbi:3-isopropylmalate dehydratase small subunit, partial [Variovorax sp. CT11-76]
APLSIDNVDTDLIVRIERLTSLARGELGPWAFEALRFRADGGEDPDFVLNQPRWREAPILVAGRNFGCGSSREGAVWA